MKETLILVIGVFIGVAGALILRKIDTDLLFSWGWMCGSATIAFISMVKDKP